MRITTNQMYTTANAHMLESQRKLAAVQEQLTSGKNFQSLSEDPLAANRIIKLEREVSHYSIMSSNIDIANMRLNVEEQALNDLTQLTNRLQEISTHLGNATLTDIIHEDFAAEMAQLVEIGHGLFNSRDAKGEYLFAGSQGGKAAYELEDNRWVFKGDSESRKLKVSNSLRTQITDSGQDLFEIASPTGGGVIVSGLESILVGSTSIYDPAMFQGQMAMIGPMDIQVIDNVGTQEMTAFDRNGNVINDRLGNPMINLPIGPAGSLLQMNGADILVNQSSNPLPTSFVVDYEAPIDNILNQTLDMIDNIRTLDMTVPTDAATFETQREEYMRKVSVMQDSLRNATSTVGGRMNNLDRVKETNMDYTMIAKKTLSGIQDLDYAKASSDLARNQTALEAAYASFAKIQGMTLFDYIS